MITDKEIVLLKQYSELRDIDFHFAQFITGLDKSGSREVFLGAALASNATGEKNICLDLAHMSERLLLDLSGLNINPLYCPELELWRQTLEASNVVGKPGEYAPLILDSKNRLYLYRYFQYEQKLAASIKQRLGRPVASDFVSRIKENIQKVFEINPSEPDSQCIAAVTAALQNICIISGGPGTGKTTTIVKALELIISASDKKPEILLAAPTGKAANRLIESVRQGLEASKCLDKIRSVFPQEAYTIHRMLGTRWGTPYFKHNEENLLRADIVVIDEASMVDLALMSKLFSAIPERTGIILVGDKDQLSSVEAGSVLGDICGRQHRHDFTKSYCRTIKEITGYELQSSEEKNNQETSRLSDNIVILDKSYRFSKNCGIGALGKCINDGDVNLALRLLKDSAFPDIEFTETTSLQNLVQLVTEKTRRYFNSRINANIDHSQLFKQFEQFKILCAVKRGPFGTQAINDLIEERLYRSGIVSFSDDYASGKWYPGKPIMIKLNDYFLGLFNGDIGIVMENHDADQDSLVVRFQDSSDKKPRQFPLYQIPDYDTAYAMTIHKSQGSEFDDVVIILPEKDTPFMTRELIYTAITRAKKNVAIWGSEKALSGSISRTIERTSGLRDALWDKGQQA